jgi:5-methylthioadenosine/S-adenosylhomocysteine deaminase
VHDDSGGIGFREDAVVVVRGGVIETVTSAEAVAELPAAERIDARGQVAMPGLINCHTHAPMVVDSGLRANLGWAFFSSQGPESRERSLEFALRWRGAANGRITTSLAPHAPYTVNDADLEATARLVSDHGLPVRIHAAENAEQTDNSLARCGRTPIETLRRTGLLDVDLLIAHGTGITKKDVPLLRPPEVRPGGGPEG